MQKTVATILICENINYFSNFIMKTMNFAYQNWFYFFFNGKSETLCA